ncbi:hypothetical protein CKY39_16120 [Variovorax boronicumulans]|uniref:Uncharacterized protein n=1 Tax=Variovorax boronicumulans TaxID=436515 RepID=A0A250DJX2_9BURK|nr:hypothetical protein [Variovorax boronicumulans]ATA54564.1 hypothetical protein CKY39_16120 [Variovorax boronicumulans]
MKRRTSTAAMAAGETEQRRPGITKFIADLRKRNPALTESQARTQAKAIWTSTQTVADVAGQGGRRRVAIDRDVLLSIAVQAPLPGQELTALYIRLPYDRDASLVLVDTTQLKRLEGGL